MTLLMTTAILSERNHSIGRHLLRLLRPHARYPSLWSFQDTEKNEAFLIFYNPRNVSYTHLPLYWSSLAPTLIDFIEEQEHQYERSLAHPPPTPDS